MKIKTSELTGVALDWAVAKCADLPFPVVYEEVEIPEELKGESK